MNEIAPGSEAELCGETSGELLSPIEALLARLAEENVRYCHWKSNIRLSDSLAGHEDFDLLVCRQDAAQFHRLLADVGFRLAVARGGTGHPGIMHAFALDARTMRLIHVHAYFQVLTGDSLVKSYLLPFDQALLSGDHQLFGIKVPPPEIELVAFLVRIALKHAGLTETFLVSRDYMTVLEELLWLRSRADESAGREFWRARVPGPPDDLYDELLQAISDPGATLRRVYLGRRLARRLRDWRRLGTVAALASRSRRLSYMMLCRLRRRRPITLHDGGAIIAFVGPKASGKSTLASGFAERVGRNLDVRRVHVGKPRSTLLTAPVQMLLPVMRRALARERSCEYEEPERRSHMRFSLIYVLRTVLLAHDRRILLLRCRREAIAGTIVVTDRYPSDIEGSIDSSQFSDAALAICSSR